MLKQVARPLLLLALAALAGTVRADAAEDEALQKLADQYNAQTESERDEVVCKWVAQTGSRIKKKVCRTKTQMKYDADQGKWFLEKPRGVPTRDF
jgi:hypothetical protein